MWNFSWSPGWSQQDKDVLRNALMFYGVGRWKKLQASKVLPGKSIMQCYLMTQHLLGQQSIVGFMGLHLDVNRIHSDNSKKPGLRKYVGVLINEADKMTKEQKLKKKEENRREYGLPRSFYSKIVLPPPSDLKVFEWQDVANHRKTLSTIERIKMLNDIEDHLLMKLTQPETKQPANRKVFEY
jgi:hypothetical protein